MFRSLPDDRLGYCLYRSVARPDLDRRSILAILDKARQRNRQIGVTGCLHFENGIFYQWIEGPWRCIFRLVEALRDDGRHMDMTILDQASLDQRLFQDWDMRFSDPEAASLFDWLADWRSKSGDQAAYVERVRAFLQSVDAR
ncbi:hypothetical protein GIY56_17010 [Paracoccus sp. YIM 132242]|uniref:BLUF domain-containing protein n=1 Tax=Paracoccus lichenicola TaxID=2665644 RepID=A0A6L6HUN9_9RHOB|nr:BLUF domain-containing protein [Paracoccus lichenicola]MTE01991.1 hypothetical protein [Paracoccus lichenicola]